jgi:hypothetical protein
MVGSQPSHWALRWRHSSYLFKVDRSDCFEDLRMEPGYEDELGARRAATRRARSLVAYRDAQRELTVVVNIEQYRWLGEIELALSCRTWGELRTTAPADIFLEILDFAGFGDLADELYPFVETGATVSDLSQRVAAWETHNMRELPSGADPFRAHELDPVAGGVYPPDPWMLMSEVLSRTAFEWYERNWRASRNSGGSDEPVVAKLIAELERVGYVVSRGDDPSTRRHGPVSRVG